MLQEFDIIHSYTRKHAIADGELVSLSDHFGSIVDGYFKYPVAVTNAVWKTIQTAVKKGGNLEMIINDLLWMSVRGVYKREDPSTVLFNVIIGEMKFDLKIVCGPDDDRTPCLTIMEACES